MIRRPPRSTQGVSSAASDVYKRQMSHIELGDSKLYPFGKGGGEVLSENLKVPLIGQLPLIEDVSKLSEKGRLNDFIKDDLFKNVLDLAESINKIGPKKKPISLKVK